MITRTITRDDGTRQDVINHAATALQVLQLLAKHRSSGSMPGQPPEHLLTEALVHAVLEVADAVWAASE